MLIHSSPQTVQETASRWKRDSKIALVPTMGALHQGHLSLVQLAKKFADKVIVSVFVNPLQFGPGEDYEKYPRLFEEDCALLKPFADMVFHPEVKDLYPEGFSTTIKVGDVSQGLCGSFRPGHFDGVATVCLKLFNISLADYAVFGEKDFQQLRVIQQMAADFNLPVTIVPHPTVRESDGVALSSRNRYLDPSQRETAKVIPLTLQKVRQEVLQNGAVKVRELLTLAQETLQRPGLEIQYATVTQGRHLREVAAEDLVQGLSMPHFFIAVKIGSTRLIDNISLNGDHT